MDNRDREDLKEAFKKQCQSVGPDMAYMAWHFSGDLPEDDLLDVLKELGVRK